MTNSVYDARAWFEDPPRIMTQLLKSAEDIHQVEHAINADLKKVDEWYEFNQMKRNHSKYQAITFGRVERNPVLTCEGTVIPIQD